MKKIMAAILSAIMAFSLCACGEKNSDEKNKERADEKLTGQYISVLGTMGGLELSGEDMAGFDFKLDKGGKGSVKIDEESGNISWKNDDESITINLDGTECVGNLGTDIIEFENFLDMGMDITFAKKGTDAADPMNYLPEEDKFMIGTWRSYKVADVFGEDASGEFDPKGLEMTFTADKMANIIILGTNLNGLPWSLLGDFGSFDTEEDYGLTWDVVDDEIEVTYSIDDIYCVFSCKKEQ